jgi:hypothetical protein
MSARRSGGLRRCAPQNHRIELRTPLITAPAGRYQGAPALIRGVAMTSAVKGDEELFFSLHDISPFVHGKSRSQSETTVDPAAIRGLGTT